MFIAPASLDYSQGASPFIGYEAPAGSHSKISQLPRWVDKFVHSAAWGIGGLAVQVANSAGRPSPACSASAAMAGATRYVPTPPRSSPPTSGNNS